jgi:hypothetical protein
MKKILMSMAVCSIGLVGALTFWADSADAIPVFARKYGLSCNSCHTMFPKLSKMGVAFRERGFRMAEGKDDLESQDDRGKNFDTGDESPASVFASNFPFTVRSQVLFSGAGPVTDSNDAPVMPGHRMGMLDGALVPDAAGNWITNRKIGFGELGLISSGSYDNFFWWMDANTGGIGMLEAGYYVNDLLKVRFGRFQNDVGYGMTMMSRRPLGFGAVDAAQMVGGSMLMMGDGISIHGTTNGDSGVGTLYNVSLMTYGKVPGEATGAPLTVSPQIAGEQSRGIYARLAQEFADNYIVGVYGYQAKNWVSDIMGGEAAMLMAMGPVGGTDATAMQFSKVTRYGLDFALNYGEPLQAYGAFTFGKNTDPTTGLDLDVRGFTLAAEWMAMDDLLFGLKWDQSRVQLQMGGLAIANPRATINTTAYVLYQVAQNVQAFGTYTRTSNAVVSADTAGGVTNARQQSFNTAIFGVDIAL